MTLQRGKSSDDTEVDRMGNIEHSEAPQQADTQPSGAMEYPETEGTYIALLEKTFGERNEAREQFRGAVEALRDYPLPPDGSAGDDDWALWIDRLGAWRERITPIIGGQS